MLTTKELLKWVVDSIELKEKLDAPIIKANESRAIPHSLAALRDVLNMHRPTKATDVEYQIAFLLINNYWNDSQIWLAELQKIEQVGE